MSEGSRRYPPELRERAVRMVFEHQGEYRSQWKAICSIGEQLGVHHESLRVWVRRAEVDEGRRPGLSTERRRSFLAPPYGEARGAPRPAPTARVPVPLWWPGCATRSSRKPRRSQAD
jgi:transposase